MRYVSTIKTYNCPSCHRWTHSSLVESWNNHEELLFLSVSRDSFATGLFSGPKLQVWKLRIFIAKLELNLDFLSGSQKLWIWINNDTHTFLTSSHGISSEVYFEKLFVLSHIFLLVSVSSLKCCLIVKKWIKKTWI